MSYRTSKDYERLWELIHCGKIIESWHKNQLMRMERVIAYHSDCISHLVWGVEFNFRFYNKEDFIKQCEQLNLEFIEPGPKVSANNWISVNDCLPEARTSVLVCTQSWTILRAFHMPKFHTPAAEFYSEGDIGDYCEEKDEYFAQEGWYEKNGFEPVNWKVGESVTHWMPLPAGPSLTLKKEQESEA